MFTCRVKENVKVSRFKYRWIENITVGCSNTEKKKTLQLDIHIQRNREHYSLDVQIQKNSNIWTFGCSNRNEQTA